ncbi:hypothetical protein PGT21_016399 [Puccinia graminis f. sp. tritici]|uniref:Uncharacterized protein n=1 Tax=Puccinia graminis f. sp. tritici TaxID=56615 RepID=A0A5B0PSK5_PUCGR|nr:hypothetical protein PGTUg99_035836 [Puccinia graminis f. sp. tritici]KAA1104251.1 hypothetical protein PGT21_016399 [Puccinia graminis f. sp. tritici]
MTNQIPLTVTLGHEEQGTDHSATPGSADPHASGHLSYLSPAAQGHLIPPGGLITNSNNNQNGNFGSGGQVTRRHGSPALLPVDLASYTSVFEEDLNPRNNFHKLQSSFAANRINDAGSLILASKTSATYSNAALDSSLGPLVGLTPLCVGSNVQMLYTEVNVVMDKQHDQGGLAEVSEHHEEAPGLGVTTSNPATQPKGDIEQDPKTVVLTRA